MKSPQEQLSGTPYSVPSDEHSLRHFENIQDRSRKIHAHALRVQKHIASQAGEILRPYENEIRSALVSESNRIENYEWSLDAVRQAAEIHRELLSATYHNMINAIKEDPRVFQALGLYKAHEFAEDWAKEGRRPNSSEVRALHQLIAAGEDHGGRYKTSPNEIQGSAHMPVHPIDTHNQTTSMISWWNKSNNDPILDASVIHAWLTHIHPFDDGNGRLARLLANLTLIQSNYPPLLLRHDSDKGQYYDALAHSDDGDILPLYDLFAQVTRRTVTLMGSPDYVHDIIHRRLLNNLASSHELWQRTAVRFFELIAGPLRRQGLQVDLMGTVDITSYDLMINRNRDGNTWFFTVGNPKLASLRLAWFGFSSEIMVGLVDKSEFPSLFFAAKDDRSTSRKPYRNIENMGRVIDELILRPLYPQPVLVRRGSVIREMQLEDGAKLVAEAIQSPEYAWLSGQ